jgi:hypothetical protein
MQKGFRMVLAQVDQALAHLARKRGAAGADASTPDPWTPGGVDDLHNPVPLVPERGRLDEPAGLGSQFGHRRPAVQMQRDSAEHPGLVVVQVWNGRWVRQAVGSTNRRSSRRYSTM